MANASVSNPRYCHAPTLRHICKTCGRPFLAYAVGQVACSTECKFLMYQNIGEPSACWEWSGPLLGGYGQLWIAGAVNGGTRIGILAHRFSYVRTYGNLHEDKPCVLHSCDNPRCTNPAHLRAGTRAENNAERAMKGRNGKYVYTPEDGMAKSARVRGENHPRARITEEQARLIKYGMNDLNGPQVATLFGMSRHSINAIRRGDAWRHI